MFETYEFEGLPYEVSPDQLEQFKIDFPNATKVDKPGKTNDSSTETQTIESNDMDSGSEDILSESQYSTPSNVLGLNIEGPNSSKSFFNKTEEQGARELRDLYPNFIFEEKLFGKGGGLDAITVYTKNADGSKGDKSTSFDMNIGGMNTYGGAAKSERKGRNDAFDILNNFITENSTQENYDAQTKSKNERKKILTKTNAKRDELAAPEVNEIETSFEDGSLFKVEEKTIKGFSGYGMDVKFGGRTPDYVKKTQPYKKELKQALEELTREMDGEKPTKEQIQTRAKDIIVDNVQEQKLTEIIESDDYQINFTTTTESGSRDYSSALKNPTATTAEKYNIAAKEFDIDFKKDLTLLDLKKQELENGADITRLNEINATIEGENLNFKFLEEDNIIELKNGKEIPERILNEYIALNQKVNNKINAINKFSTNIQEKAAGYEDNVAAIDISRRNYNGTEEFIVETALGTGELLMNTSAGINMFFGGENKELIKDVTTIKEKIENIRDSYSKDVEFDDAFNSLSNFASFAMQEVSNQIPIFAALAIPGGQAAIGFGAFGDQYVNLANERDTKEGRKKSNANIWWSSVGFGASELVFESLTTLPLIRAAKKGFNATPGKKTLFDMTAGKYFKKNIGKTVYGALSEPVGEGMTQLTQNFIDGKPLTEGLDHAMFSGLMFGTTLSSMPFARGLYLSKFNDHVQMKNVRKRVDQIKKLNTTNLNIKINLKGNIEGAGSQADIDNNLKIIADLQAENLAEMKEVEANLLGTSNDALKQYFALEQGQEGIKNEAQAVVNNNSLNDQQKTDRLKVLQVKFDRAQSVKDQFRDKNAFGDEYTAFSGLEANKDKVAEIEKEARSVLNGRGKKDPTKVELFDQAKIIYNTSKINASHAANQRKGLNDVINAQTKEEAIEKVNNLSNVDDDVKKETIKGIQDGNHGVNIPTIDGKNLPMQIVESMAADDRLETRTHEVGHSVFIKAISQDSKAFDGLADQILEHLKITNPSAYKRVSFRLGNQTASDEVVMLFLEEVASGKVNIKNSEKAGFFATLMNKGIEEVGGKPVDLRGETDAINFLVGIAKKIKDGTIKTKDIADIRANVIAKEARATVPKTKAKTKVKASKVVKTPEQLVKIIKRGQNPQKIKEAEDALAKQFELLALSPEALNYDTRKGEIAREDVVAEAMTYLPGIIKRFDPATSKFSTFVIANMRPKQQVIYEKVKPLTYGETTSIDTKEAKQVEGDAGTTTNTENTFVQKINILQDFAIANRVADKIKALVKVGKGDNFKSIISKYAGKVGELIFEVPAKKIMEGGANLAAVTKYTEGMPAPAEAQNIQRFFNAPNNADKFIKTLPLYNVTDKTADINKVGENLDVSRDTYGYAIGIKGLPLDYFYENYTDPTGGITSLKGRSKGLTSQTPVKRLKPQFRKPTPEVVGQFKKDLGITPKNEANVYSRDIGQLLKGVAKVHSINAAISGAQRFLEAKTKAAPVQEQKAIKQQTADITAAQSKVAFSQAQKIINIRSLFELETKGRDKLLSAKSLETTLKVKTEDDIKRYINMLKKDVFILLPKEAFFGPGKGTAFTSSSKILGVKSSKDPLWIKFKEEIQALKNDETIVYGPKVPGVKNSEMWSLRNKYNKLFATPALINKNKNNGEIQAFNKQVAEIHKAMWVRINESVKSNKTSATGIMTYLGAVANDTGHWHKMGAQFVGSSKKITGKRFEFEHAMPATAAYLYLMDASLSSVNFDSAYKAVIKNYKLIALDKAMDVKLTKAGLQRRMPFGWDLINNNWWDRYFNESVANIDGGIDPRSMQGLDGRTFEDIFNINKEGNNNLIKLELNKTKKLNKTVNTSRKTKASEGITVLDFDDTLATTESLVKFTRPDGTTGTLNAEEYASTYEDLLDQGFTFDFSDFNKVVKGKLAPLFNKAIKLQGKFGPENMFVLTARPPQAVKAIFDFLKANGLNIPIKNITGLGNSTAEAKALWVADKVGEGYNDFYFADDALQNVQAVKNMLEQFDVKSKVQQAKVKFSETMNDKFNEILENVTSIEAKKRFSAIKGRKRGESKGKFRFFIPPSHEDFVGLLYNFLGKGKEGNAHRDFFEKTLIRPLNRANREYDTARQSVANDYKALNKQFVDVRKKLTKKTPDGDFTFQDAIRVYLWDKHGYSIPGLSPTDQQSLVDLIMGDQELKQYAETLNIISKQDTYVNPTEGWNSGDIRMDLDDATGRIGRQQYFSEFIENAEVIFSEENLNKIEAAYGKGVKESLQDMLYRIKTGRNRPTGQNEQVNKLMNYLNGSVGTVMFFNMRSALLQQMSIVNYINFADNNIFAAAKAFANQKQYWADWSFIFNSDMLKQRRGGIQTDVNGAELAASLRNSKDITRKLISKLLELGFLPTQIGDNIAIATGGATYYRNKINKYVKQGLSQKEAEAKAFTDFQAITQSTQQSARPDMVSKQQASVIGKVILNFQNVTSQFNRLGKKAFQDIYNRRITGPNTTQMQSDISNAARITYYFAIQNAIFYTLQTALFAMMFGDDEEDDNKLFLKKKERLINGSIDSVLRGTGLIGGVVATLKNVAIAFARQRDVKYNPDESAVALEALNLSPVLGIKMRKIVNAEKTLNYNKKVIKEMETFDIDNPQWSAVTNYTEAFTNIPLNRLYNKTQNVRQALNNEHSAWERSLMFLGWSQYNLNLENKKMEDIKESVKSKKKSKKKKSKTFTILK